MMRLQALSMGCEMRRLLRKCDARLADLPLPDPFSIQALVASIEDARGRRIQLIPVEEPRADLRTACGLRIRDGAATYVLYRRRPTPHQTEHTILHELSHEWMDHGVGVPVESVVRGLPESLRRTIMAGTATRQVVHARSRYETDEEGEAELSAYLIKQRVRSSTAGTDLVSRLESSLSRPLGPQHSRRLWGR